MDAHQSIITRQLPKTGQVQEYQAGDDGTHEAGWWLKRLNVNNKLRFIVKGAVGSKVTLDRATGLMWKTERYYSDYYGQYAIDWGDAVSDIEGLTFAGYSDWRLPNAIELLSITNFKDNNPAIYTYYFEGIQNALYWTSTTQSGATTRAFVVNFTTGILANIAKDSENYARPVRGGL